MNPTPEKSYGLTLDRREKAVLTGVTDVERFDENEVVLHTHGGRLILSGTGLHVSSLQLEEGRLLVDGAIDGLVYDGGTGKRRGGFLHLDFDFVLFQLPPHQLLANVLALAGNFGGIRAFLLRGLATQEVIQAQAVAGGLLGRMHQ